MNKIVLFVFSITIIYTFSYSQAIIDENFSSNTNNWQEKTDMYFEDGKYHIFNEQTGKISFIKKADLDDNMYRLVNVDMTYESGATGQGYGLFFRATDINNGYLILIAAQGYYSFGKLNAGKYTKIKDWTFSKDIKQNGTNKLFVMFDKQTILVNINSQELFTINEQAEIIENVAKGGIGFYSAKGVHASFDNLKVNDDTMEGTQ